MANYVRLWELATPHAKRNKLKLKRDIRSLGYAVRGGGER